MFEGLDSGLRIVFVLGNAKKSTVHVKSAEKSILRGPSGSVSKVTSTLNWGYKVITSIVTLLISLETKSHDPLSIQYSLIDFQGSLLGGPLLGYGRQRRYEP